MDQKGISSSTLWCIAQPCKIHVEVDAASWFVSKRDDKFYNQKYYIFNMVQRINQPSTGFGNVVFYHISLNAFPSLPEYIFSKLKSNK